MFKWYSAFRLAIKTAAVILAATGFSPAHALEMVYQTRDTFLEEAFDGRVPEPGSLWLVGERRDAVVRILGHEPGFLRLRYWRRDARTVWILDEIGKTRPITAGFQVNGEELSRVAILIYREERGDEVRHGFFTRQFKGARLNERGRLNQRIDAIAGATLSVNAIERLARLSLYLTLQAAEESGE